MANEGLRVDRQTVPTSIELSTDEAELRDPQSYAVTVSQVSVNWWGLLG